MHLHLFIGDYLFLVQLLQNGLALIELGPVAHFNGYPAAGKTGCTLCPPEMLLCCCLRWKEAIVSLITYVLPDYKQTSSRTSGKRIRTYRACVS